MRKTRCRPGARLPIALGMVDPVYKASVLGSIVQDIRKHGNSQTSGDVGYRFLIRALADEGRSDLVYDINNQSKKPGYGFQLRIRL